MELLGYDALRARQRELRAEGRLLGIGFSPFVEQGAWAGAIAAANGFPDFSYLDSVSVAMEPDGTVTLTTGLQSNGQGHETTMAQVAADQLGVRVEDVTVVQGDTAATAYATGQLRQPHGGDRQRRDHRAPPATCATSSWPSPRISSRPRPSDLELGRRPHLGARLARSQLQRSARWRRPPTGGRDPPTSTRRSIATRSYDPPETYSNACIAVVVEVDAETGQVRDRAHRRRRGLRHRAQPGCRRGAGDRRHRAGHRRGAVRAAALRRGRATSSPARSSTSSIRRRPRCRRSRSTTSRRRRRSPRAA